MNQLIGRLFELTERKKRIIQSKLRRIKVLLNRLLARIIEPEKEKLSLNSRKKGGLHRKERDWIKIKKEEKMIVPRERKGSWIEWKKKRWLNWLIGRINERKESVSESKLRKNDYWIKTKRGKNDDWIKIKKERNEGYWIDW